MSSPTYFQRGLGLGDAVKSQLEGDYHSGLVDRLRDRGHALQVEEGGRKTVITLAREFGFCYGVERAVDYAYQTRKRFRDRDVYITGEIIHNPGVNTRLLEMGIRFLDGYSGSEWKVDDLGPRDVVILPAFGVTTGLMEALNGLGCVLVDATCGSVLNVWKNVERYAQDGFTSVIHGKYAHEETRATSSRATSNGNGHYVVVRDHGEADRVCREIEGNGNPEKFLEDFRSAVSDGFDPRRHLERIGVANQTTMLSSESLEIAEFMRASMIRRFGEKDIAARFRSFDTICSATQDRQDAVRLLITDSVELIIVIGGYNSSNTNHLTEIAADATPTFHIENATCLIDERTIRHLAVGEKQEITTEGWLSSGDTLTVGVTAGASTPNSEIGRVIERLLLLRGATPESIAAA